MVIEIPGVIGRKKLRDYEIRSLIFHSEYVKEEFPRIYQFIADHQKNVRMLDEALIEQLSEEDLRIVDNIFSEIILRCKDEWDGSPVPHEELEGDKTIPCSICNAPTKKIYHIKNKFSNKVINVGSTCIDQFLIDGKLAGKTKAQLRKEGERAKRLTIINERFPGIKRILEKWDDELNKYDVLIPNILSKPYQDVGNELMYKFQSYTEKSCGDEVFDEIERGLQEKVKFIEEFRNYNAEHMNNKFVATKRIATWLKNNGDLKTLELLKESGYIGYNTAPNIHEPEFILEVIKELTPHFTKQRITIVGTDHDEKGFIVQPFEGNEITFICKYKAFLEMFGWVVFGEKQKALITPFNVVYISEPYNQRSFDKLIFMIKDALEQFTIKLNLNYYHDQDHDLDLYDTRTGRYLSVSRKEFAKRFKTLLIKPDLKDDVIHYVDDLVSQGHKTLTWDDLKQLRTQSKMLER